MEFKNLLFEIKNRCAYITINRPEKLNALNNETLDELRTAFIEIKTNDEINVAVITGSGEKAFVAGADIKELNKLDVVSGKLFAEKGQEIFNLIEKLGKPVIAAVNGYALGGGCELAMACHIRIASENSWFGQPEVNLGIIPGYGGTQRLTRLVNAGRAAQIILSAEMIDAKEALRIGLVNSVCPAAELMTKATQLAETISSKGQNAVRMALRAIVSAGELSETEGQNLESALFALCCGTDEFKEGTTAFLEKRKPDFSKK